MLTLKHDTMLGNIPDDWDVKPLKELLETNIPGDWGDDSGPHMTSVIRSTNLTNDRVLNLSDIAVRALKSEKAGKLIPRKGDILLERSGGGPDQPVGRIGYVHNDLYAHAFSNFLHLLRPNSAAIDPAFLSWLLFRVNRTGRILRLEQQTTQMRNLNFRDYLTMLLPVPPLEEQVAIARVLDAVDAAIRRCERAIQSARQLRKSLLSELLSCGVDEKGRVRNRRSSELVETPLGRLPAPWELRSVGSEFELQNGFTINEDRRPRFRKRKYLRVANVQRDALALNDVQELEAHDKEFAPRVLQADDLLVVEGHADRLQIGRCAIVDERAAGFTFQNHLFRLRTCGQVAPDFGCLWLNSEYANRYWNARCATSSGLNTINQRTLRKLVVPVPPKPEQDRIVELVQSQRAHLESLVTKRDSLSQLKKSLMHDLLTGTVRVNPSLSQVAEAV